MELVQAADEGTLFWFENHHRPWLNEAMKGITELGDRNALIAVVTAAVLGFLLARRPRSAAILLGFALFAWGFSSAAKAIVHRPRPDVAWRLISLPTNKSFPSGHALNAMTDYVLIALLVSRGLRRRGQRQLIIAAGLTVGLLVGFSRPYLGVHYPTDVLGGWTAGLACAMLAYWIDLRWDDRTPSAPFVEPSISPARTDSPRTGSEGVIAAENRTGFKRPT
jgi:undecaprenyl-diphosphatase